MMKTHLGLLLLSASVAFPSASAQTPPKKPLGHDVYDSWMRVTGESLSGDSRWIL
jgi:hypothetical protein